MALLDEAFDVDNAPERRAIELIPARTEAAAIIVSNRLQDTKNNGKMLVLEFEIIEGPYSEPARHIWQNVTLRNTTSAQAVEIGTAFLGEVCRAVGIKGTLKDADDLMQKPVRIVVSIEKDKTGQYGDRNGIGSVKPYRKDGAPGGHRPPAPTPVTPPRGGAAPVVREIQASAPGGGADIMDDIPF